MKAAYIFYFQYSFQEIRLINMYFIIHDSVIIYMCCKSVWLTIRAIQFNCKLLNSFHFNCISYPYIMKMSLVGDSDIRKKVTISADIISMFIICTNTCFNLHIIFIRFVHGVSYLLHRIFTRFISM